uniref:Putative ovule protein n=1 Tax=Solanum chacoense TaxID=4108 RepID=A0A0V0GK22_SOLCH
MLFSSYSYVISKLKFMIPLFTSVFFTEVNYFFALLSNTNIQICCKTVNSRNIACHGSCGNISYLIDPCSSRN